MPELGITHGLQQIDSSAPLLQVIPVHDVVGAASIRPLPAPQKVEGSLIVLHLACCMQQVDSSVPFTQLNPAHDVVEAEATNPLPAVQNELIE